MTARNLSVVSSLVPTLLAPLVGCFGKSLDDAQVISTPGEEGLLDIFIQGGIGEAQVCNSCLRLVQDLVAYWLRDALNDDAFHPGKDSFVCGQLDFYLPLIQSLCSCDSHFVNAGGHAVGVERPCALC